MVSIICGEKIKEELYDFYHNIDENVIERLKELCIIHDMPEERISAELLSYVTKWDHKELNVSLIDQFQTEHLHKKAIIDQKKSSKSAKVKNIESNIGFKRNEDMKTLREQFISELNDGSNVSNVKPTTRIEVASNGSNDENNDEIHVNVEDKTPEKEIKDLTICENMDVSSMTTPVPNLNDSINTSLKIECCGNSNIICYFGNSCTDDEWMNSTNNKHNIDYYDKSLDMTTPFKFMSLKISESNEIMNDYIDEFSQIIKNKFDIESWSEFSAESAADNCYIGRIRYDWDKYKLDDKSVMFEGSSYITNNETIRLDLSRLSQYSLFPGQVLAFKATNESRKHLIVRDIIDIEKTISHPKLCPTLTEPLNLVVAVGPFTKSGTLNYEPLKQLMKYVKDYEPNYLIIMGPIVDSTNDKLLSTDDSVERIFNTQMRFINDELLNIKTEAIIIPSTRDINTFNVLPTMPFTTFKSNKMHFYPNPTILNINGVIIGMTSTDVLLNLSKEEISAGQNTDRLSRLCKHIICQKNFYPIFPPNNEINLEFTKYDYLRLPVTPHILLLPSDLKQFAKNIMRSVVINSGRLLKNNFARIKIDPIDDKLYNGSLEGYTNVEIIKMKV